MSVASRPCMSLPPTFRFKPRRWRKRTFAEVVGAMDDEEEQGIIDGIGLLRREEVAIIDDDGVTLLHYLAGSKRSLAVVQAFVEKLNAVMGSRKAQEMVDALDSQQRTALSIALPVRSEAVSLFLVDIMSPKALGGVDRKGWSCLAYACDHCMEQVALKLMEKLPHSELFREHHNVALRWYGCGFARGIGIRCGDPICGGTPLHFAARNNLVTVVEALLKNYAEAHVEKGDRTDRPAEVLAALRGHEDLVRLFWEKAPLSGAYWAHYSVAEGTALSNIRQFFHCYHGALGEELIDRLIDDADEALLRELLCCAIAAKSPDMIRTVVAHLSQAAIDEPLLDGTTPVTLCRHLKEEVFIPLLLKSGPKSAAC